MGEANLTVRQRGYIATAASLPNVNYAEIAKVHGVTRQAVHAILTRLDVQSALLAKREEKSDKARGTLGNIEKLARTALKALADLKPERLADPREAAMILKIAVEAQRSVLETRERFGLEDDEGQIAHAKQLARDIRKAGVELGLKLAKRRNRGTLDVVVCPHCQQSFHWPTSEKA